MTAIPSQYLDHVFVSPHRDGFCIDIIPRYLPTVHAAFREQSIDCEIVNADTAGMKRLVFIGKQSKDRLTAVLVGWKDWWDSLDEASEYHIGRLWSVLSAEAARPLSIDDLDGAVSVLMADMTVNDVAGLIRYLDLHEIDEKEDYPFGKTLPQKTTGGGKNDKHASQPNDEEIEKWKRKIKNWLDEIQRLKRTSDKGKKKFIKKLKDQIRDAQETLRFAGENHSQRDKGYTIPGFHEATTDDDETVPSP